MPRAEDLRETLSLTSGLHRLRGKQLRVASAALLTAVSISGCTSAPTMGSWDGRRGYDGRGDYGYDPGGSDTRASGSRTLPHSTASRTYRAPGPPEDPWGPHIREAAVRFRVPEGWIRAIMRQESGGRLYNDEGGLITSRAGAMGLMQVMPGTYSLLRAQHRLGSDPYEPRDNILAGAAYIRAMHDRFGAPGFAAAYNAGPERVEAYLAGAQVLPDETIGYLASVTPALGIRVAGGPWAEYAGGGSNVGAVHRASYTASDGAYAGGGLTGAGFATPIWSSPDPNDPTLRAYDGGGLVTPGYPTGVLQEPSRLR